MSQNPASQKKSSGIDFTATIRSDTYDFIKPEQFDLSTRSVLVTGASKGLGKDNAISFARAGASQIAIAARSGLEDVAEQMKEAAQKAGREEPTILSLNLDVTDKQSVSDAAAKIEREFGSLDIVINNAGYLEKWVSATRTNEKIPSRTLQLTRSPSEQYRRLRPRRMVENLASEQLRRLPHGPRNHTSPPQKTHWPQNHP
jgi:NAD(P)-dependent dehydrogenase (short-subunit alcohol dehydrogenase family)